MKLFHPDPFEAAWLIHSALIQCASLAQFTVPSSSLETENMEHNQYVAQFSNSSNLFPPPFDPGLIWNGALNTPLMSSPSPGPFPSHRTWLPWTSISGLFFSWHAPVAGAERQQLNECPAWRVGGAHWSHSIGSDLPCLTGGSYPPWWGPLINSQAEDKEQRQRVIKDMNPMWGLMDTHTHSLNGPQVKWNTYYINEWQFGNIWKRAYMVLFLNTPQLEIFAQAAQPIIFSRNKCVRIFLT